ncbi:hypothetical protein ACIBCM_00960 [Streptomyces sp. NPDC051018]|uniref:hypothetical protein n=1 Tax=Streptomyces sp. NPDC051018 TaxID=3365639 RepID=UPI0037B137C3
MTGTDDAVFERTLLLAEDADSSAISALAAERGWPLTVDSGFRCGAPTHRSHDAGDGTLVHEVQQSDYGVSSVTVVSRRSPEAADEIAALLADALETVPLEAVVDRLLDESTSASGLLRALRQLAAAYTFSLSYGTVGPDPDPRTGAAAERLLRHPHRSVRLITISVFDELRSALPVLEKAVLARRGVEEELAEAVEIFAASAG